MTTPVELPSLPRLGESDRKRLERGLSEFANRADGNGELIVIFAQGAIRRIEIKRSI